MAPVISYQLLVMAGLLLFAVLAVLRREYGVYLIVLLLPAYQIRFAVFGIPMTFLESMILILAAASIPGLVKQYRNIPISQYLPILLFLLAAFISIFISPVPVKAAGIFKAYFFEPVLFYFLVRTIIDTPQKLHNLCRSLAVLVIYLSVFALYQFLTLYGLPVSWWEVNVAGRRVISLLNHPNALALLLGPIVALLVFLPRKTKLHGAAIVLGIITVFLTLSRAGWLALAAGVAGAGLFTAHRKKIVAAVLLAFLLVLVIPFSRGKLRELLGGTDPTQENRYLLWSAGADIIKKSPLFGAGLMGFHEKFKDYPIGPDRVVQNYPHNFFLNFWVETGLPGLLSAIWLLILFYKKILEAGSSSAGWRLGEVRWGVFAAMTVILLHGLVDVPYFKNDLSALFWLIYGLGSISARFD